jgi:hypothetical protein
MTIEGIEWRWNEKKGDYRFFSRGRNVGWRKRRQRKWTKKVGSGKKGKGEHKREDTMGKAQVTEITKTTKVKVLYWNVIAGLRKKKKNIFGTT